MPIPVVQGTGVGGLGGGVGIEYRPFGVQLQFTGEILSDSLIKLNVTPEVSSLDFANAITDLRVPDSGLCLRVALRVQWMSAVTRA